MGIECEVEWEYNQLWNAILLGDSTPTADSTPIVLPFYCRFFCHSTADIAFILLPSYRRFYFHATADSRIAVEWSYSDSITSNTIVVESAVECL